MTEYQIREFVCDECGHKVVVNPQLPADYTPNICTPCYDKIFKPRHDRKTMELFAKLGEFFKMCSVEPPPTT
jgi:DNA-directed RNA polymerase subunit RPC12/RpoP